MIFGGVRRIAHWTETLVPAMALLYLLLGLAVVLLNAGEVPRVVATSSRRPSARGSSSPGGVGVAIVQGMRRGMFSNEAGLGSAPNAGATASVSHPVKQGLVQCLGVYFDTLLICSVTAFIILVSGPEYGGQGGVQVTQVALESALGGWAVHALTVILFLLAFSSVLGNYYYGETNLRFLDADPHHLTYFRAFVLVAVFVGSVAPLTMVWALADVFMGLMAVINLVALIPLSETAFRLLADYGRQYRTGLDPQFTLPRCPTCGTWSAGATPRARCPRTSRAPTACDWATRWCRPTTRTAPTRARTAEPPAADPADVRAGAAGIVHRPRPPDPNENDFRLPFLKNPTDNTE
ncbi:alanine:cation symporter family protein [Nocardiopsis sp. CNR-923]|uniref:alanine:cation symporter family protein n=1 Tax=Nocardiopsis sp. CNR-923 TaxID=1904965 RepID=UPI00291638F3|nr:alanine:cation symporter family protein [Nocardiopsis sp. CNR-923]